MGTFNGNPLAMAATRAMLCEVATPEAYQRIEMLRARAAEGIERAIADAGLTAHVVTAGAKGCVVFAAEPVRNFRGFLGTDDRYSHAHWLYQHNRGVFLPPWGKIEQWLISVQHDEADIDRLVENFAVFARAVERGLSTWRTREKAGRATGSRRKLTRRSFLGRSAGAALAALAGGSLLDACASGLTGSGALPLPRPNHPVRWPLFSDNSAIASGLAPEKGATLQVYNWVAYVNQACVNNFAKKYKCKVQVTTFNTMDEAIAKLRSGLSLRRPDGRHRRRARPAHRVQAGPAAQPLLHPEHRPGLARLHQPLLRPGLAVHGAVHDLHDGHVLA